MQLCVVVNSNSTHILLCFIFSSSLCIYCYILECIFQDMRVCMCVYIYVFTYLHVIFTQKYQIKEYLIVYIYIHICYTLHYYNTVILYAML